MRYTGPQVLLITTSYRMALHCGVHTLGHIPMVAMLPFGAAYLGTGRLKVCGNLPRGLMDWTCHEGLFRMGEISDRRRPIHLPTCQ